MNAASPRPFTGRHMLFTMLGFFAVVFAANGAMVYHAINSWSGLVVKNSYVASQEFNAKTAALRLAEKGVHAGFVYTKGKLLVHLTDDAGTALAASNVTMNLGRPSHEGEDRSIAFQPEGTGFVASHQLASGQWAGTISADITGRPGWQRPVLLVVKE